jgi:phosphatidylglycerol lysyltransferase
MLRLIIAFVAIYFIYTEGSKQLKKYDFREVINLLYSLDISKTIILFTFGFIAVSSMTIYDYFLLRHIKYELPLFKVWKISWIANSFNNFLSFAGLTGASLRTFLYRKQGVSTKESIYVSAMMAPSTIIGICAASWLLIFDIFKIRPILIRYRFLWIGVILFALYLIVYILLYEWKWLNNKIVAKVQSCENNPKKLRWKLVGASLIEWIFIGLFFWKVCTIFSSEIMLLEALGIISISAIAGILSFIPGGMGSFDLICLVGLESMGANSQKAMAILITFRIFYYIMPWLLGIVLGMTEIIDRKDYRTT